jgi:hypothetical protein
MSDVFYGVNMGAGIDATNVSKDTSTTSKKVELRVEDGVTGNNKKQVILAIEAIKAKILKSDDETA